MKQRLKPDELQNIFRIDTQKASGKGATHGWQVRISRAPNNFSQFFNDRKYGSKDAALIAALEYRNGIYDEYGINPNANRYYILTESANNTSGIIGVCRSESLNRNCTIYECWQTTYPAPNHVVKSKRFSVNRFGEIGALCKAIEERMEGISALIDVSDYANARQDIKSQIDKYLSILVYLEGITPTEEEFLTKTMSSKVMPATEKEAIISGRIGQQTFKDKLTKLWGNRCAVTGARILLNAAHIKPWASSTSKERLDPFNGFLLSPSYDKAFDNGLITFSDDGHIIVAQALRQDMALLGISDSATIKNISPFSAPYLSYHREKLFKDALPNKAPS